MNKLFLRGSLLGQAIEAEVEGWLESHKHLLDNEGHRQVVGNGRLPGRTIDADGRAIERFRSKILPPYLRKIKSIEELIPWFTSRA